MKVKKVKNPFIFWLHVGTCCRNLTIIYIYDKLWPVFYVLKVEIIFFR